MRPSERKGGVKGTLLAAALPVHHADFHVDLLGKAVGAWVQGLPVRGIKMLKGHDVVALVAAKMGPKHGCVCDRLCVYA